MKNLCVVWVLVATACTADKEETVTDTDEVTLADIAAPAFVADEGLRIEHAGNAKAGYNADATVGDVGVYVYHQPKDGTEPTGGGAGAMAFAFAYSEDGLAFADAEYAAVVDGACDSGASDAVQFVGSQESMELPDGSGFRRYSLRQGARAAFQAFESWYSSDGIAFCEEDDNRYELGPTDAGTMGVYTTFAAEQTDNQTVLLYLGDLVTENNTRRAVGNADGTLFTWERDDVLGDAALSTSQAYVDISTLPVAAGIRRLYAMQGGTGVYSFLTDDDGKTFTQEDGARIVLSDYTGKVGTGKTVCAFFDPTVAQVPDSSGKVVLTRMYVTALVWDAAIDGCAGLTACSDPDAGCTVESIVSAASTDG